MTFVLSNTDIERVERYCDGE